MTKYDRIMKRRSKKVAEKDKSRRVAAEKTDQKIQKQKTWRRDKNGNFIFKNKIRFSYVGIFIMIIVTGGIAVFGYGVFTIYLTDFCNTEFVEGFSFACGFVADEGVTIIPQTDRDYMAPTSAITEERIVP